MQKEKSKPLTAENLKQILWQTLNDCRNHKIDVSTANAVAQTSKEIMAVVNTEIKLAQMNAAHPEFSRSLPLLDKPKKKRVTVS